MIFVLLVTSIKEGNEDLARSKSDKYENNKNVTIVTFDAEGKEHETVIRSQDVNPGDIIKLTGKFEDAQEPI